MITDSGEQLGILATSEALSIAEERGLDLVEVAPDSDPPVCRLLNFDKLRYERKKNQEKARKNIKKQELKEIRLKPHTSDNDIQIKTNKARKFLESGDKVKVTVQFRGREIAYPELGEEIVNNIIELLSDVAEPEKKPALEHKKLSVILKAL